MFVIKITTALARLFFIIEQELKFISARADSIRPTLTHCGSDAKEKP